MKRSYALQSVIGICLLTLVLSCHKRGEFEVPCKILKIAHVDRTGSGAPYDSYAGYFTYTPWGDPERITWDLKTTGRPDYVFRYDKKHRLIGFDGLFDGTVFDFVTRYQYDGDRIASDTFWYSGGDINNFRATAYGYIVNKYTYDSKGRIIRIDSQTNFGNPPYFTTYDYDAAGNKVRAGAVYDNKKSYLRTNVWLMFVTRDFSVNNYKVADEYNKKGLPLTYNSDVLTFMNSFINEIDYSCDNKYH